MKKFLLVFFIGQLLLVSYIFNKSVYDIYELNNVGDNSLHAYQLEKPTGNDLSGLYDSILSISNQRQKVKLQVIKMPVSEEDVVTYEIYHSDIYKLDKTQSISKDTIFRYHALTKEDFIDSTGVFYTNLNGTKINQLSKQLGIDISPYLETTISYLEIIRYNLLNIALLILLTTLVLFIYVFTGIKVNAIKKLLGFSSFKMLTTTAKEFLLFEFVSFFIVISFHFIYYTYFGTLITRYLELLVLFLLFIIIFNLIILMLTQISLKFIDISAMMKNKVYSNRLNMWFHLIKIILLVAITSSVTLFLNNYHQHEKELAKVEQYKRLKEFYSSNAFNADESERMTNSVELKKQYSEHFMKMYDFYNKKGRVFYRNTDIVDKLSPNYLVLKNKTKNELFNSMEENYTIVNKQYLFTFLNLKGENNQKVNIPSNNELVLLVPEKYKTREVEVKNFFIEQCNYLLFYDQEAYDLPIEQKDKIKDINIIYLKNNQSYRLFGVWSSVENQVLNDTIILVDNGQFGRMHYLNEFGRGGIFFKFQDRNEFKQMLIEYGLDKLALSETLFTPFMGVCV